MTQKKRGNPDGGGQVPRSDMKFACVEKKKHGNKRIRD